MRIVKIEEGDIIEDEDGIFRWIEKIDNFSQELVLEELPYTVKDDIRHMEDMKKNAPERFNAEGRGREKILEGLKKQENKN